MSSVCVPELTSSGFQSSTPWQRLARVKARFEGGLGVGWIRTASLIAALGTTMRLDLDGGHTAKFPRRSLQSLQSLLMLLSWPQSLPGLLRMLLGWLPLRLPAAWLRSTLSASGLLMDLRQLLQLQ